ncbi:MAG: DnaJ domain-containing protein, partial [Rhodospirillales bacterium]
VNRNNNNTEIKSAYRKLIRENHPDTLIAQGMPPEFVAVANEKMAAINAAYDVIEKERRLR